MVLSGGGGKIFAGKEAEPAVLGETDQQA